MTIEELIKELQNYPQDMQVAYRLYSEHCLLNGNDLQIIEACKPRDDGWIQGKRPDMEKQLYLAFPGN
ncbi:MAG: hypothetical protein A2161_13740 [Candidatus Schekmanbacteria bacterium RBG_13_48_7]|uniref:Uncharacterized protein n=1 Tax=Candidatus Schekmanbacteria bacterium RBG_13_48_7 TaxID=1817878 RepID=A0A1F7RZK9_9BACT|nr:MAG: hypothetical protein A2161_13740 [Candidatus Schekmanbacteria bacterium RBG_13_48_7]